MHLKVNNGLGKRRGWPPTVAPLSCIAHIMRTPEFDKSDFVLLLICAFFFCLVALIFELLVQQ